MLCRSYPVPCWGRWQPTSIWRYTSCATVPTNQQWRTGSGELSDPRAPGVIRIVCWYRDTQGTNSNRSNRPGVTRRFSSNVLPVGVYRFGQDHLEEATVAVCRTLVKAHGTVPPLYQRRLQANLALRYICIATTCSTPCTA